MTKSLTKLGRRERQIMDVLVRRKRATAADVLTDLPDAPSYSAVRGMLRLLEDKGYVKHEWDGPRQSTSPRWPPSACSATPSATSSKPSSTTLRSLPLSHSWAKATDSSRPSSMTVSRS